eukprot:3348754-Alexandrium_andersonii.AAC.1
MNKKPLKKRTRLLTNSEAVHREFADKFCQCTTTHQAIIGSDHGIRISTWAAKYPGPMCAALVQCMVEEC